MNRINGHEALNQRWHNVEPTLQMYTYNELVIGTYYLKRLSVIENVDFVQSQTYFSFYSSVTQ